MSIETESHEVNLSTADNDTNEYVPSKWEKFTDTKFGYWVERTFLWKYDRKIRDPYYELKWKIQRGKRGWSDSDSWNMNNWFFENAYGILDKWVKSENSNFGHPMIRGMTCEKWKGILTEMRDGFKAWIDDENMVGLMCKRCNKETCHGDDTCKCEDGSALRWSPDYNWDEYKIIEDERQKKITRALQLFARYAQTMWD